MAIKLRTFTLGETTYFPQRCWSSASTKVQRVPSSQLLTVSPELNVFVANTFMGFIVCEDYSKRNTVSEVDTQGMLPTAMEFAPCESPLVAIFFVPGQVLLIDPFKRSRGAFHWFNTEGIQYSESAPSLLRWVDSTHFAILFQDNTLWVLHKDCAQEDKKKIAALRATANTQQLDNFQVIERKTNSNPQCLWKFHFSTVTDLKFAHKTMVLSTADGQLKLYNFAAAQHLMTFYAYFGGFCAVAVNEDCSLVAAGGEDDAVSVWKVSSAKLLARCIGHRAWPAALAFNASGKILSAGQDGRLMAWELPAATCTARGGAAHVPYPVKEELNCVEPALDFVVSQEPLGGLSVKGNDVFVCGEAGIIAMWCPRDTAY